MKPIPVIDVAGVKGPATATAAADALADLVATARRLYTAPGVAVGDRVSRRWIRRCATPYADELHEVARALGRPGAYVLNLSYEWACTTGAADDGDAGPTIARVLDWSFDGLGRHLVAARCTAEAGDYVSLTWPGYVGVLTAMAPGRFCAALNQPPLLETGWGCAADWLATRARVWRSTALPPSHLLRLAFDECRGYEEAKRLLCEREICVPVFFTLAGTEPGQCCVIERTAREARVTEDRAVAVANHWTAFPYGGDGRGTGSAERRASMARALRDGPDWSMRWLKAPILNPDSRVVMMANARTGRLRACGLENGLHATRILDLPG